MRNEKGFSGVEGLLLLILVALIGFTGYYVYNAQNKANKTYDKVTNSSPAPAAKDVTTNWKSYSSTTAQFSVKYPSTWATGTRQTDCPNLLMLGPSPATAGACQTDGLPEVAVTSQVGDKQVDSALLNKYYPDVKKVAITVNGVQGYKYSGTFHSDQDFGVGPTNGTKSIAYVFYTSGRTYVATYNQKPDQPDVMADFNLMATKTWQFHP